MLKTRLFLTVAIALALVTGASARLLGQGITTGAVSGTVTDANGAPVEGAQVQVRNPRTGASAGGLTRANGQYNIQGIEPDPGYSLTVRRIGFEPQTQHNILVSLGQTTRTGGDVPGAHQGRPPGARGVEVSASGRQRDLDDSTGRD